MTGTRRLAQLTLDEAALKEDLSRSDSFRFTEEYSEFSCGAWKGTALCNQSGQSDDTRITDYEGSYQVTDHGRRMPYVMSLINTHFRTDRLRFARLARMTPGSVLVPHRDYLELHQDLVRIHIPLHTSSDCFNSENETIYQMKLGDIWFIDATQAHSAVSFFAEDRTHLIVDFSTPTVEDALAFAPEQAAGIPSESLVPRRPLTDDELAAIRSLSSLISERNYRDVLSLLLKQYFVSDMSVSDIFDRACEMAEASGQDKVREQFEWLRQHSLTTRLA